MNCCMLPPFRMYPSPATPLCMAFPQNINNRITTWASHISLSQHTTEVLTCASVATAALFTITELWKQPRWSSRITKENVVHAHNRIFFSHKEQNYVIYSEINTTGDNCTKWIKSAAEKQISHAFFHLWILNFIWVHKSIHIQMTR